MENKFVDEKVLNSDNPEALHWSALSKYCGIGTAENEEEAFKLFEVSAKKGYVPSQRALAFCYKNGLGVKKDKLASLKWQTIAKIRSLNKIKVLIASVFCSILIFCFYLTFFTTFVAEKLLLKGYFNTSFYLFKILEKEDNPKSYYFLGSYHLHALGELHQDKEAGKKWIKKGFETKDPLAALMFASFLPEDSEESETIIQNNINTVLKMAEDGNAFAQTEIGNLYNSGSKTIEKNSEKAFYWWSEAAKQGHVGAHNNIAFCYGEGVGVAKDEEKAIKIFKELAENRDFAASKNLASHYINKINKLNGELFPEFCNLEEQLALKGDAESQYYLARCYCQGCANWKERNEFECCKWDEKAASQGFADSQYQIGICYFYGTGVNQKDPKKACEWFEKAADKGIVEAQFYIGYCYVEGIGVEKDPKKGCEWYEKAALQEYASSQYGLGLCYYDGIFEKNDEKAKYWLRKAASQNYMDAINMLWHIFHEKVDPEETKSK